jgi:hypothetical protein
MRAVIGEPSRHQLWLTFAICGEHPRVHARVGKIVEVLRIVPLYPETILRGIVRVSNSHWHENDRLRLSRLHRKVVEMVYLRATAVNEQCSWMRKTEKGVSKIEMEC